MGQIVGIKEDKQEKDYLETNQKDGCNTPQEEVKDYLTPEDYKKNNMAKSVTADYAVTDQSAVPGTVFVEVLVAVDDTLFKKVGKYYKKGKWIKGKQPSVNNKSEQYRQTILYLRKFMSAVDHTYQELFTRPKVKLHIAGVLIDEPLPFIVKPDGLDNYKTSIKMMEYFGNKTFLAKHPHDIVLLLHANKVEINAKGNRQVGMTSGVGSACYSMTNSRGQSRSYGNSIALDHGQFRGVEVAVHEIGHLLGSKHDGDWSMKKCCSDDGYVMKNSITEARAKRRNGFIWSKCSTKLIEAFLKDASKSNCLFNKPASNRYPLMEWKDLSKAVPSLTDQCSVYQDKDSDVDSDFPHKGGRGYCGDDPCQFLQCQTVTFHLHQHSPTIHCDWTQQPAMEGSWCSDDGKRCFHGDCSDEDGWRTGYCLGSNKTDQNTGVIKLGKIGKKRDCLASCKTFSVTACEWKKDGGECTAHTDDVEHANGIPGNECFVFQSSSGCTHTKFGYTIKTKLASISTLHVDSASACMDNCKTTLDDCYVWSYQVQRRHRRCDLFTQMFNSSNMEELKSAFPSSAWGTLDTCSNEACVPYQSRYVVDAADYKTSSTLETHVKCKTLCQQTPDCVREEIDNISNSNNIKCTLIRTKAKGLSKMSITSNANACLSNCKKNKHCLQWSFKKFRLECRHYSLINRVKAKTALSGNAVGTKYSCVPYN